MWVLPPTIGDLASGIKRYVRFSWSQSWFSWKLSRVAVTHYLSAYTIFHTYCLSIFRVWYGWNPTWQISTAFCWTLDEFGENRFTDKQNFLKGM